METSEHQLHRIQIEHYILLSYFLIQPDHLHQPFIVTKASQYLLEEFHLLFLSLLLDQTLHPPREQQQQALRTRSIHSQLLGRQPTPDSLLKSINEVDQPGRKNQANVLLDVCHDPLQEVIHQYLLPILHQPLRIPNEDHHRPIFIPYRSIQVRKFYVLTHHHSPIQARLPYLLAYLSR